MKKISLIILIFTFLSLIAVNSQETLLAANQQVSKLQIVTSLPLVKNITQKIGGDMVMVESIIQGPTCNHEYEPTAKDMKQLAKCDVFIKIGMGSDPWADKLTGILTKKTLFIDPSKGVKSLKVRGSDNPHYWGSPDNIKIMANNILNGLSTVRPEQKNYFQSNYQKFLQEMNQTTAELKAKVAKVAKKPFVSYANAFPYFFSYFGFQNLMTVELSCEQEVSPKDVVDAAKLMKQKKITVLVGDAGEPNEPDGLAKETKAKKVLLWETTDESGDYLLTLQRNVKTLVMALQ